MKAYNVYEHPHFGRQIVKEGFIWPAFFFTFIWAWVKGMVAVGFAILILSSLIGGMFGLLVIEGLSGALYVNEQDANGILSLISIGIQIFIGFKASKWRCNHLKKKGYKLVETVDPNATPNHRPPIIPN